MTEYKQLCAELVELGSSPARSVSELAERMSQVMDLADRARAALAKPEPEGPTDEEILELMPQQFRDDLATVSRLAAHGAGPDIKPGLFRVSLNTGALDFARAVLARWGNHLGSPDSSTPQPVPVSERLPGDELCWWYEPDEDDGYGGMWTLLRIRGNTTRYSYWLPANALTQPS